MTAQELVSKIWQIGLMDPVATRMENAAALLEADRKAVRRGCADRACCWHQQYGFDSSWGDALRAAIMGEEA